jgi:hypothetical protein
MAALAVAASRIIVSLSNLNVSDSNSGTSGASYELTNAGVINSYQLATPTAQGFWVTPQTGFSAWEVRATLNSGALTSGTTGSWLNLGTSRVWECSGAAVSSGAAQLLIEIRDVATSTVQASATINLDFNAI